MPRKRTAIVNFTLRLREDLRRQLEREADKAGRSLNNEIVRRLEQSFSMDTIEEAFRNLFKIIDERTDATLKGVKRLLGEDEK